MKSILRIVLMVLCLPLLGWAQSNSVTGKVTTASGESLPGVNVLLKGSTNGTITDADGNYKIDANGGTLVFSFIGYEMTEIAINGRAVVDVTMNEDVTTLEQVVVIGYGTQKKKELTTAVAIVDETAIAERPMVSAAEALQGKAAGVQVVQNSGKPGAPISVRIRGSSSMTDLGNQPLYVVDGVQTQDISGLNPSDIASMSILKDAASASIYGARGSDGVVIITTKRGRANAQTVRFETYMGFSKIRKTIDVLNTEQYKDLMEEIVAIGALDPAITNNTNWNDEVFGTGVVQNYQLSLSGGSEKSQYLISGNYLQNQGMVDPAIFDRYSVRINLDNQLTKWFKLGTNFNFLHIKTKNTPDNLSSGRGGVLMSTLNTPPFLKMYKSDGSGQFDPNPFQASWENPGAYMYGPEQQDVEDRLFGNLNSQISLLPGLAFKTNLGIDISQAKEDGYLDPFRTNQGRHEHGMGYANRNSFQTWIFENLFDYSKSFGVHNLNVIAGSTVQETTEDYSYMSGTNFPEDTNVKTLNAANSETGGTTFTEARLVSFLARVVYDYDGKYLLTASVRRDGSSKLANPWGTMPSVSVGWRISQENFMKGISAINDLKIRYSYGVAGNEKGLPPYAKYGLRTYQRVTVAPGDSLRGPDSYQSSSGNKDLKWETSVQSDLGVDLTVLDSRLTVTFDAYIKKTNDLIIPVELPSTTGIPTILTNAGTMENKGIELNLSSVNVDKELTWTTDFNISFNRNKVTYINPNLSSTYSYGRIYSNNQDVVIVKPGLSLGTFYGYISDGVDPATGNLIYRDLNNSGPEPTADDRTVIGSAQPDFIYGLTNNLSYKRWKLNIFFQGSQGNDIYNSTRIDLEGMFDHKNQSTVVLNRWTPDNTDTDIPRADNIKNVNNSTRFVEDGSYLRLKVITLSYDLNPDFLQKIGIRKLSIYGTGQNLLTFTNYSGFDPEVNAFDNSATVQGVDYGTYPQAKTVIFGINLEF